MQCLYTPLQNLEFLTLWTVFLDENSAKVFGRLVDLQGSSTKRSDTKSSPWFDAECRTAKRDFTKARNLHMKHKNDMNRQTFVKYRTKYNRIKSKAKQKYKIAEGQKLNIEARKQPRKCWRKIKSLRKKKEAFKGQKLQMKDLLEHFQSTFSSNDDALPTENNDPIINEASFDPELDCDISLDELKQATFHQKNNAAYGLDNVCAEAIKKSFDLISESLLNIVNHVFNSRECPETWRHGIISPIFKGSDPDLAKNCRGITISNFYPKYIHRFCLIV